jgi:hypothetical protein
METLAPLPPKLKIAGVWRDDPEVRQAYLEAIYPSEAPQQFEGELVRSPEHTKQFIALGEAFLDLGSNLGLDLRGRIPNPNSYHVFDTRENLQSELQKLGVVVTHETLEAMTLASGIYIADRGDDFLNMCVAAHETFHYLAQKQLGTGGQLTEDGIKQVRTKGVRSGYGYRNGTHAQAKETFQGLDELATEVAYLDLLNGGYWDRQPDLPKDKDRNPTFYTQLDIIGDELIQATAKKMGVDPITIVHDIERDVLTGSNVGIRKLTSFLKSSAPDGIRQLIHAPNVDPAKFLGLAEDLNLPNAVTRIEGLEKGKPAEVLTWLRAKRHMGQAAINQSTHSSEFGTTGSDTRVASSDSSGIKVFTEPVVGGEFKR